MVLGFAVKAGVTIPDRLSAAVERVVEPDPRSSYDADTLFSDPFVERHTAFDSTEEFYRACPCEQDSLGGARSLSAEERDEFVAATTEFETWTEMKDRAAVSELVTLAAV